MKPIFFIGIAHFEDKQSDVFNGLGDKLKHFFDEHLFMGKPQTIDDLLFEPRILVHKQTTCYQEQVALAQELGLVVEDVSALSVESTIKDWHSFLNAKSNLLVVLEEPLQADDDLSRTTTLFDQLTQLPATSNQHSQAFYYNINEFLPYIIVAEHQKPQSALHFRREGESASFDMLMVNLSKVCEDLAITEADCSDMTLASQLASTDSANHNDQNASTSLMYIYQLSSKFDKLANKFQKVSNIGFWSVFSFTLILSASFLLYAKVFKDSPSLLIVYLITYSIGLAIYYQMKRSGNLKKHLAYRLCAETLRMKIFQFVAEDSYRLTSQQIERRVSNSDPNTLWILHIIRTIPLHRMNQTFTNNQKKEIIENHLIIDQLEYFEYKLNGATEHKNSSKSNAKQALLKNPNNNKPKLSGIKKLLHHIHFLEFIIVFLSVLMIVVVTLTAFKISFFTEFYPVKNILMFLVGFLPLIGLAFEQLVFNFAIVENEKRYHQQISLFKSLKQWLANAKTEAEIQAVTRHLCESCLQESFNWYTTRINRQHKPASGG